MDRTFYIATENTLKNGDFDVLTLATAEKWDEVNNDGTNKTGKAKLWDACEAELYGNPEDANDHGLTKEQRQVTVIAIKEFNVSDDLYDRLAEKHGDDMDAVIAECYKSSGGGIGKVLFLQSGDNKLSSVVYRYIDLDGENYKNHVYAPSKYSRSKAPDYWEKVWSDEEYLNDDGTEPTPAEFMYHYDCKSDYGRKIVSETDIEYSGIGVYSTRIFYRRVEKLSLNDVYMKLCNDLLIKSLQQMRLNPKKL